MKLSSLLAALLVAGVVSAAGCKKEQESLIVVALTADSGAIDLRTLTLSAQSPSASGGSKSFSINGLSASAVSYGLYVPGDVIGDVTVTAVATAPGSCMGYTGKTTPAIRIATAGSIAPAAITLRPVDTCQADGGTGTGGQGGSGGSTGTAGAPPPLVTCNEYSLHASSSCIVGAADDNEVDSVAFSPDGRLLVTTSNATVKVWTLSGNLPVAEGHILNGQGFAVVAFSPNGSLLAVGWEGSIELWNVSTWTKQPTLTISSSTNSMFDIGFSPDGQQVISIDSDLVNGTGIGNLYVHSITSPQPLHSVVVTLPFALAVSPVATASGGSLAAVTDESGNVGVYTVGSSGISGPTTVAATSGTVAFAARFSPDGTLLAAGGKFDSLVHFWRVPVSATTQIAPDIDIFGGTTGWSDDVHALAFSPNGQFIAVGGGDYGSITTWYVSGQRNMLDVNTNPTYDVTTIAISPSGGNIAAGELDCGLVMICGN